MATKEAAPKVKVTSILDGKVTEFGANQRMVKSSYTTPEGEHVVRLDFSDGETRLFKIRPDMLVLFALHGAEQKLGDEISGMKDKPLEDVIETIDQLMQRLSTGPDGWNKERESGGMAGASVLARALVQVTGQPIETVRAYLNSLDNKVKLALRESDEVKPVIQKLEAEAAARRAAAGKAIPTVDVAAALANLRSGGVPATPASPLPEAAPATV